MEDRKRKFERLRYTRLIERIIPFVAVIQKAVTATSEASETVGETVRIDMSDTLRHLQDAAESLNVAIGSIHRRVCMYKRLGELDGEDSKVVEDV